MRAKKSLGQNFLSDSSYIQRIVDSVGLAADDQVLEIGPGRGALTGPLLDTGAHVTAVEFDRDMVDVLNILFGTRPNLKIVQADALSTDLSSIVLKQSKVVANLPYNISTPILQKLSDERGHFSVFVLMFQREVANRISAATSTADRGFLSVIAQHAFSIERLFDVPPTAFRPAPKVWSSVIRLTPKPSSGVDEQVFRTAVSRGFAFRRKTLFNNLKGVYENAGDLLQAAAVEPSRRAETLTVDEWETLAAIIAKQKGRA